MKSKYYSTVPKIVRVVSKLSLHHATLLIFPIHWLAVLFFLLLLLIPSFIQLNPQSVWYTCIPLFYLVASITHVLSLFAAFPFTPNTSPCWTQQQNIGTKISSILRTPSQHSAMLNQHRIYRSVLLYSCDLRGASRDCVVLRGLGEAEVGLVLSSRHNFGRKVIAIIRVLMNIMLLVDLKVKL